MSDLSLVFKNGLIDLDFENGSSLVDDGLRTAVIISLFSDRRADVTDILPDGEDRRGWWGDAYPSVAGDRIGSRLWLNDRAKQMASVLRKDETYVKEALAWMIEDGVAAGVAVKAANPASGVRAIHISITKPSGAVVEFKFDNYWETEHAL